MSKVVNRCKVCGTEYEYCPTCGVRKSWHAHTDTEEHYYIFGVLMDYRVHGDADRAYHALEKRSIDVTADSGFVPSVQTLFAEIAEAVTAVEPEVFEEAVFEETTEWTPWSEE